MKIARIFLMFFAMIFCLASLGFYLYVFFTPLWDMSVRMIPLYLYPGRMFLILSILLIALVVFISKKKFDENTVKKICVIVCSVMVCTGIVTTIFAYKDYQHLTFKGLSEVEYESAREKYVPYNYLFETDDNQESEYYMQHKSNSFASYTYVENYFPVRLSSEIDYGAELFKSDNLFLRLKFNAEKMNPLSDESLSEVVSVVGQSGESNGIKYTLFVNEDNLAVKIAEDNELFYIYLLSGKQYGVTEEDFVNVAIEQYTLLKGVSESDGEFLTSDEYEQDAVNAKENTGDTNTGDGTMC